MKDLEKFYRHDAGGSDRDEGDGDSDGVETLVGYINSQNRGQRRIPLPLPLPQGGRYTRVAFFAFFS